MDKEFLNSPEHFLLECLDNAINGGVNFTNVCLIFPPEVRGKAVLALKAIHYSQSAEIVESLTGQRNLGRLWE